MKILEMESIHNSMRMAVFSISKLFRIGWLLGVIVLLLMAATAHAKVKFYTVVEKTRAAELIIIGQVVSSTSNQIVLRTIKTLKGPNLGSLTLVPDEGPKAEMRESPVATNDIVLAFANPSKTGGYRAFAGSQGMLKLESGWDKIYETAISQIVRLDAARSPETRTEILREMLVETNRISQYSALEIVYMESHLRGFQTEKLYSDIVPLTRSADRAVAMLGIQVLGRIGGKTTVPVLIDLLADHDPAISLTAYRTLKGLIGRDIEFDPQQPIDKRQAASANLRAWWKENSDNISIIQ